MEIIALAGNFLTSKLQWNDMVILETAHIEAPNMRYDINIRQCHTRQNEQMRIKLTATSQPDKLVVHAIAVLRNQIRATL